MINTVQVREQLKKLIKPFGILSTKLQDTEVIRAVTSICHDMGADDDDLYRAIKWLIKNGGGYNSGTGVPSLVRETLTMAGGLKTATIQSSECSTGKRNCLNGFLRLELSDKSEVRINCPFCQQGENRVKDEKYIAEQKAWAGEESYNKHQAMIREAFVKLSESLKGGRG